MGYPVRPALPPRVDPVSVRPRRFWYAVAAFFASVGVLSGAVFFVLFLRAPEWFEQYETAPVAEFDSGVPATVQLSAAKPWGVFVRRPGGTPSPSGPTPSPARARSAALCTGTALDGGAITLTPVGAGTQTQGGEDGAVWELVYEVQVNQDGRYRISCGPADDRPAAASRYRVEERLDIGGFLGTFAAVFGAFAATWLAPCAGLTIAGVIAGITAIRRHNHRRRLLYG